MRALLFASARTTSAGDRIALFVIAVGIGLLQWAFWQGAQTRPDFSQNTNLLYASLLSLFLGGLVIGIAFVSSALAVFNVLFEQPSKTAWPNKLLTLLDRVLVLSVAIIGLLLLNFFAGQAGPLAAFFRFQGLTDATSVTLIGMSQIFIGVLAFFALIALIRLRASFGWPERVLLLLCGVVGVLLLTDSGNVRNLGIFSANTQLLSGNAFSSLNLDQVVALCILIAALFSLFWLLRTDIRTDRVPLGIVFGIAAFFALLDAFNPLPLFLFIALFLLLLGIPMASRIEQVRRGNATSQIEPPT